MLNEYGAIPYHGLKAATVHQDLPVLGWAALLDDMIGNKGMIPPISR